MAAADVVVVGSYNQDALFLVDRLPAPGETCLALERRLSPGGKGSNQAIQAALCGADVALIAAIGADAAGEEALAAWARAGVGCAGVARLEGSPTGGAVVIVDRAGENSIIVNPGANAALDEDHVRSAAALIGRARIVAAQLETPQGATRAAFEIARAAGVTTLLNAAPAHRADALLPLTDVLVVNEGEGERLTGLVNVSAMGPALLERVRDLVVVTLGGRGARLFRRGRDDQTFAAVPATVVDTTGAGDAFIGALLAELARAPGDLDGAVAFALAAGALACEGLGAVDSFAERSVIAARAGRPCS